MGAWSVFQDAPINIIFIHLERTPFFGSARPGSGAMAGRRRWRQACLALPAASFGGDFMYGRDFMCGRGFMNYGDLIDDMQKFVNQFTGSGRGKFFH